jgi:hypothetical protein
MKRTGASNGKRRRLMKRRTEDELTRLADAAFAQAAQEVIERAEQTGTPVILCVNGEVKAVDPGAVRKDLKRARRVRRAKRR